jgi:crotonobetainyl-CoA:carnitine CoA-transferase CaiB-like acyl-CoA transferase
MSPYYRLYQCSDEKWIFLAAVSPDEQRRLSTVIGSPPEADKDGTSAVAEYLTSRFASGTAAAWFARLDDGDVPVEIVDEEFCRTLFDDPEAKSSLLVAETWSGSVGRFEDPGLLVNLSPATCVIQRGPSMCGEHTRELLLEQGYSEDQIDALAADHAILDAALAAS